MAGLQKEVWLADLIEQWQANTSFVNQSRDFSMWVENDKINLAEAGILPEVYINYTSFPVPTVDRADTPISLELNTYDTQNNRLRKSETIELAYDKRASVMAGQATALIQKFAFHAAWSWAPQANDANNKIFDLSATTFDFDVIIDLQAWYDSIDAPEGVRNLMLCPSHQAALQKSDLKLYKSVFSEKQPELYGFKLHKYSKTPRYAADNTKKVLGAANAGTDKLSTIGWLSTEVCTALGTNDMYERLNDPDYRCDIIGFQQRALAIPIRNKYASAILK